MIRLFITLGILGAGAPELDQDHGIEFFEKRIRPLLVERCYECHSAGAKKLRGGLRLDFRAGWERGGDSGSPAVVPGAPERSLLIRAVRHEDPELRMPPRRKLAAAEIALLERWVRLGAPDPRDDAAPSATDFKRHAPHWSFEPPRDPPPPAVADQQWPSSPLDRFVLSRLEGNGLAPAPRAGRRVLIRRVTFDLIGLPPDPDDVEAFVADRSPDAFARLVDRLLASPQYGERWARHWLDVARYADSNGLDENVAHGNAWRYRDYVVDAFNGDKSYDRFVTEQLAGDLLDDRAGTRSGNERLIATGFLALGPKVLAEGDETKMEMDIIDEQIDTVGRSLMGLTLGCARCHDHKYDPLTTEDYYALAGIFKSTQTMESYKRIARWHEHCLATPDELAEHRSHANQIADREEEIKKLDERLKTSPGSPEIGPELERLREEVARLKTSAPVLPFAMGVAAGKATDLQVHVRGSHLTLGKRVRRGFPAVLAERRAPRPEVTIGDDDGGRLQLARWLTGANHPLTARVICNRLWRWHFGRGLVATPDNFGRRGAHPSHPLLLDWLAHRLVEGGWSIKKMHRLILLSSTYRMSSAHDPAAARKDPGNFLLWRMPPRRLEAEALRDSLLAVAGSLDLAIGGTLLDHVKNREFLFDHTSRDGTRYTSRRRSLYLPVIRNHLYDFFQLFDFPDPGVLNGDRATTTVASQALFLMNSGLLFDVSERIAADLLHATGGDAGRVRSLYLRAYGRPSTAAEVDAALAFVRRFHRASRSIEAGAEESRSLAWQALSQVIVTSSEFVHVR